ncbi:hypothetical protein QUB70_29455 [Microcoleus sp. A003_D6]|uniref:hypothetical protein n=2 Tax=Microcoleus TaxID=44471 RepID=UPI002FD67654
MLCQPVAFRLKIWLSSTAWNSQSLAWQSRRAVLSKNNSELNAIEIYMANNDFKVLQIIEAKGWYAFGSTKQSQHVERWVRPVVCWVLIEDKKKRRIVTATASYQIEIDDKEVEFFAHESEIQDIESLPKSVSVSEFLKTED